MRIATLQFAPKLGDVEGNVKRADELLLLAAAAGRTTAAADSVEHTGRSVRGHGVGIDGLRPDILVLPELAMTGYNFPSLQSIRPFLEVVGEGRTADWARRTAKRLRCKVCVGYPELAKEQSKCYNSLLVVDEMGHVIVNYRKAFLYYTDESWASEGDVARGFARLQFNAFDEKPVSASALPRHDTTGSGRRNLTDSSNNSEPSDSLQHNVTTREIATSFGICMDINPYKFEAPFTAWEFANRILDSKSQLVIVSMAWLTHMSREALDLLGSNPDMDTFNYWIRRFWPLIERRMDHAENADTSAESGDKTVIVVFANRAGEEQGQGTLENPTARYAGTSAIVAFTQRQRRRAAGKDSDGPAEVASSDVKILCWDLMGATDEGICFADTTADPKMVFTVVKKDQE